MCFRFSVCSFVKQLNCPMFEAAKNLWYDWRFGLFMHANIQRSQAALARNCALSMAADLFLMMVGGMRAREIYLLKGILFRRFIAENTPDLKMQKARD